MIIRIKDTIQFDIDPHWGNDVRSNQRVAQKGMAKPLKELTTKVDLKLVKELETSQAELVFIGNPTLLMADTFATIEIVVWVGRVEDRWPKLFGIAELLEPKVALDLWKQHGEIVGKVLHDRRIDPMTYRRNNAITQ